MRGSLIQRFCMGLVGFALLCALGVVSSSAAEPSASGSARMWEQLISGATTLRLPTGFLKAMPPDFVRFEFDDLRTYAAEYHPGEHRMVLNRTLSFHAAGRDVRSLTTMTPKELEVLYHELFHAYIDHLESRGAGGTLSDSEQELIAFAREMQVCRYREVSITPVVQRIHETEVRYLSDPEAWEALNETWAVFVGWAVWNQLEIEKKGGRSMKEVAQLSGEWVSRFRRAIEAGELRGYYAPQDPDERRVTQKRFLAPGSRISKEESRRLMKQVLGLPEKFLETVESALGQVKNISVDQPCQAVAP
ncbi:MAG: conserved exported protein of unknown function [Nitrospira sp.]|nr:MAG: conserved exported protein of unknown function [Nitrospira sp.]